MWELLYGHAEVRNGEVVRQRCFAKYSCFKGAILGDCWHWKNRDQHFIRAQSEILEPFPTFVLLIKLKQQNLIVVKLYIDVTLSYSKSY